MAGGQQISREKHVDIRVRNLLIGYSSESLFFCLLVKKIKASLLLFCHERHERREQIYHGREESESHPSQNLLKLFSRSFSILLYVLQFYGIQYTCKNYKNLNKWRFKIYCNMLSLPLVLGWAYSVPPPSIRTCKPLLFFNTFFTFVSGSKREAQHGGHCDQAGFSAGAGWLQKQ